MKSRIHFILGGNRSGKSLRAETIAAEQALPVTYVATYADEGLDDEMKQRVKTHQERRLSHWKTVEERFDLTSVLDEHSGSFVLIDSLTLWLSWKSVFQKNESEILKELQLVLHHVKKNNFRVLFVGDELGMSLVPSSTEGRAFRDLVGRANQIVAAEADHVELSIAGLPLVLKGEA
ncbi:MAG: bifunctional adenosylcobinamide kinase/adenosylcobinamide-phosphate guanylyltransferase [Verrucomicrobiota bacterium]